jgi:DNA polymerase-3 subunit alpha
VEKALDHGTRSRRDRDQGQAQLFGGFDESGSAGSDAEMELPEAPPWNESQHLAAEKEALGLYWSGHPIERYAEELAAIGARNLADLSADEPAADDEPPAPKAFEVLIGGIIASVRQLKTKKGDRMAAFQLDDPHGTIEVVAFPEAFAKAASLIQPDTMVLVKGKFEKDEESMRMTANEVVSIDVVRERAARFVSIKLSMPPHDRKTVEALSEILSRYKGDRRVSLEVTLVQSGLSVRAEVGGLYRVRPTAQLVADVERLCGEGSVALR